MDSTPALSFPSTPTPPPATGRVKMILTEEPGLFSVFGGVALLGRGVLILATVLNLIAVVLPFRRFEHQATTPFTKLSPLKASGF